MTALKTVSPFAAGCDALEANGYHVIPIGPNTKAPSEYRSFRWFPMERWERFRADPPPALQRAHWKTWPDANIGVVTGTPAGDESILAVFDFDTDDPDALDVLSRAVPPSPVAKKGKRGYSSFYRVAQGTKGYRTPLFELLTDTRQTVVPPSIHPDTGQAYAYTTRRSLADVHVSALPFLDADALNRFRDTLETLLVKPIAAPRGQLIQLPDGEQSLWRRINNMAYANLEMWVPELGIPKLEQTTAGYKGVAHWRPSATGRPIALRGRNLSIMRHNGAKDFGTGESYTALDLVMACMGFDLDDAVRWLGTRLRMIDEPPELVPHDPETGEIVEAPAVIVQDDEFFPDALTEVPGLVGDITSWISDTAQKPSRVMAMAAAITVVGTVIGRAVAGPSETGTHLYVAVLAPSGANKSAPLVAANRLLASSNNDALIGPSEFASMSAVVHTLKRQPLALCVMDEVGAKLKKICDQKAQSHAAAVPQVLREIWGLSFETYVTQAWANLPSTIITSPAISILGASNPKEFFDGIGSNEITNGFLNRWLILSAGREGKHKRVASGSPKVVPDAIRLALAGLRTEMNQLPPDALRRPIGEDMGFLRQFKWGYGAEACYEKLKDDIEKLIDGDETRRNFYARTAEMAQRLAVIRAAGQQVQIIGVKDMEWGRDVSMWSSRRMERDARDYISDNEAQRNWKMIRGLIARHGGEMSRRNLANSLSGRLKYREIEDIIKDLIDAGQIIMTKKPQERGGHPLITYRYAGNLAVE